MKIKIEEYWQVGSFHYLDAVIGINKDIWVYQQLIYDDITKRFTKEGSWLHKRQSVYA